MLLQALGICMWPQWTWNRRCPIWELTLHSRHTSWLLSMSRQHHHSCGFQKRQELWSAEEPGRMTVLSLTHMSHCCLEDSDWMTLETVGVCSNPSQCNQLSQHPLGPQTKIGRHRPWFAQEYLGFAVLQSYLVMTPSQLLQLLQLIGNKGKHSRHIQNNARLYVKKDLPRFWEVAEFLG